LTVEGSPILWLLAAILVVAGIAGTVLPALPGAPLVFAGLLLGAWSDHFQKVGWFTLVILGILTLLSTAVDLLATAGGARRVGASWLAVFLAGVGGLAGFVFSLPGFILGPFVGAFAGELLARRGDWRRAGKVGLGTWLGMAVGAAAKLALIFTMIGVFALAYFL
jgi:uncharacterized protein YqgC (DUF456 family)